MSQPVEKTAIQTVRGMHDFLPGKAEQVSALENLARRTFAVFGFKEIRTPVMESADLFQRAIGEATDIVEKEMFTLKDRGDRTLCLRPEGTAGVVRSYIENSMGKQSALHKLFYIGPMFRAERPQAGRFREFIQIGAESFGSAAPGTDAETIAVMMQILNQAGIRELTLKINSIGCKECRPVYQKSLLEFLNAKRNELCGDCQKRMVKNPLRALDCKEDRDKLAGAPKPIDFLCAACKAHHEEVLAILGRFKITPVIDPQLVRGLDYYSRTVFEVYPSSKSGSQDALAAGGRYDALVEMLGGDAAPAVGFAMGAERVLNYLSAQESAPALFANAEAATAVIWLGDKAKEKAFEIVDQIRRGGKPAVMAYGEQSMKSQMRFADGSGARFCVIIGDNELAENSAAVKDLNAKSQEKVPMDQLISYLKQKS